MSARRILSALAITLCASCSLGGPAPGMRETTLRAHPADPNLVELARLEPSPEERALLVVYPRSACSGSASAVLLDDHSHFLGAVAPGTAALLSIPVGLRAVTAFSSVEVTAAVGTWSVIDEVGVPDLPRGLIVRSTRLSARQCGTGQYVEIVSASKGELELLLRESEVQWFEPRKREGQAWLDAHRARVDDILGCATAPGRCPRGLRSSRSSARR